MLLRLEKLIDRFQVPKVTTNSITTSWNQKTADVQFIYIVYFPVGESRLASFPKKIALGKGPFPLKYVHEITKLFSCMKYKIVIRVYDYVGCGISETHIKEVTTRASRKLQMICFYFCSYGVASL